MTPEERRSLIARGMSGLKKVPLVPGTTGGKPVTGEPPAPPVSTPPNPADDGSDDLEIPIPPVASTPPPVVPPATPPAPVSTPEPDDDVIPPSLLGEEEPPAQAEPEPSDDEVMAGMNERQKQTFIKLRTDLKKANDRMKEIQAGAPATNEEVARLKSIIEQKDQILARVDLAHSEAFKKRFDEPMGALIQQGKAYLKALGKDEGLMIRALQMPIKERIETITREAPELVSTLQPIFTNLQILNMNRTEALKQAKTISESEAKARQEALKKNIERQRAEVITSGFEELKQAGHFLFEAVEGDDRWNAIVQKNRERAEQIVKSEKISDLAKMAMKGVAADSLLEMFRSERKKRLALEKELGIRRKMRPGIGASSSQPPGDKGPKVAINSIGRTLLEKRRSSG